MEQEAASASFMIMMTLQVTNPTRLQDAITAYDDRRKHQKEERIEKSIPLKLYKLAIGDNGFLPGLPLPIRLFAPNRLTMNQKQIQYLDESSPCTFSPKAWADHGPAQSVERMEEIWRTVALQHLKTSSSPLNRRLYQDVRKIKDAEIRTTFNTAVEDVSICHSS
jgi:hypothetical protein